jgi:uncharacterized protein (DUF305 family)
MHRMILTAFVLWMTATPGAGWSSEGPPGASNEFQAAMDGVNQRMHVAMDVPYSGDADRDFARMMIPHHQGAVDMALVELRYGKDERLKRLAQEIIVAQKQEIEVMQAILREPVK